MEFNREIIEHYSLGMEEKRLGRHSMEKIRSQEIIMRYLPKPPARILDVGGAHGVYSFWLSQKGYDVHLVDIVPLHVDQAGKYSEQTGIKLASALVGDARDLPYPDNHFDVVLLMGPLYHLTDEKDRIRALSEAKRVLKTDGVVICAAISRFASMLDGFRKDLVHDRHFMRMMKQDLINGQHRNDTDNAGYFTTSFFHHPDELKSEIARSGLDFAGLFAVEGFSEFINDIDEKCKKEEYLKILLDTLRSVETEESLLGLSNHLIGVGKKRV